jgi:hypothetical protein
VDVCGFEVDEVLELLNWGRLHGQEAEACPSVSTAQISGLSGALGGVWRVDSHRCAWTS